MIYEKTIYEGCGMRHFHPLKFKAHNFVPLQKEHI